MIRAEQIRGLQRLHPDDSWDSAMQMMVREEKLSYSLDKDALPSHTGNRTVRVTEPAGPNGDLGRGLPRSQAAISS